jgi:hypothetical protein
MVEAGGLWVEESNPQRGIFPAMQRIVNRVLKEFAEDIALFEDLLDSFEHSMKEQQRKTDTMEKRTQEAARGREKLHLAKRRANHEIHELLDRTPLPSQVTDFLSKTWLDQLVFILLRDKDADRSDTWKQAVRTAENLVQLFEPGAGKSDPVTRADAILDLQTRIVDGVQHMGSYSHSTLDALFALLKAPETWREVRRKAAAAQARAPDVEGVPHTLAAQAQTPPSPGEVSEQEHEVIVRLRKMKFGTWFELASDNRSRSRRLKLSWLSPLTSTCMFVDRSGMQAEIKTLQELANEMLSGRAKVIPRPKHPFIERALVSIRKMLQRDEDVISENTGKTQ